MTSAFLAESGDDLYAPYHDAADTQDFHYKTTPITSHSWAAEQTITYAQDVVALSSWNRDVLNDLHIGGERATDVVWYHALSVAVVAVPELSWEPTIPAFGELSVPQVVPVGQMPGGSG